MKSPKRTTLCLMFIVIYSSKATLNWNLESTIHPLSLHEYEPAGEEALRQKRAVATKSPAAEEYTVNIEISFENASFLDPIKGYLNSLSFPIHGNNTDQILSINVTTVCRPTGNEIWCSCETGYGWPRERCLHNLTCQEHDVFLPGHHCSCLKELPTKGPFCLLQEDVTLNMRVRLNVGFQEDLMNTSSALYRSYKTDLETAFWKGYGILPGFKGVTVTGFKSGSVVVTYEVKTTAPSLELIHKANEQVVQSLNQTYKMDYNSFQALTSRTPETDIDSSCSRYTLKADGTQCPSGSSGTTVVYTCEFISAYGARGSANINVTFISVANLTMTPDTISVSEGQNFSIKCISDVSNYDEVYWNTSAGIKIYQRFYTTRRYPDGAESVLTVKTSTREWNGTYHCIFRYKNSYSIATKDVVVHWLPLELNIMVDPLEATVSCSGSHHIKCCVEEDGDYKVTFHMGSLSFPAEKEINKKQVCYKHNFNANSVSWCSKAVDVYCHFTNAANNSVWSPPMKLNLVPGENITCQDPIIGVGEPGKVIQKLCRFSNIPNSPDSPVGGIITYKCVGSQWKEKRNDCISAPVNSLLQMAKALIKSPSQDEKLPTYLKDLSISIDQAEHEISSSPGSLGAIINILDLLSTVPTEVNSETMMHVLSTVNVILGKPVLNTWKVLQQRWTNQSSQLLHSVERFSQALQSGDSPPLSFSRTNVQMSSMVIKSSHPKSYQQRFVFPHFDLWGNVVIDKSYLENLQSDSSIVTMAFPTLQAILAQDIQENNFADSLVMTTTVSHNMTMPFRISMTFKNNSPSGGETKCVFWNFQLANNTGGWDSNGCYVEEGDGDNVTCICDHLTSFSILMSPDSPDPSSLLGILLDIISYVGVGFSILSLAACLVVEAVVWKSVTKNRTSYMRHTCIVNIAASLLIANTWFIVVAAIQDNHYILCKTACVAATFFIHFFYLSVFFWMLTLGLMLFYRLVFILHETSRSTQKAIAFCLGYGCPLAISVITLGATQPREVYTRKNVCWLNWEDTKALLAFAIPALIIVVVNITITIVVITKILRPSIGDKPCKQEKSSLFQISKSIGVLTPLLGLTWGFGLTTVFPGTNLVFHIIFAILNVFQGLFILLFGCLWDLKVQEALLNKFSLSRWSSQHSKSTSLGSSTPVFSMSSPISRRFNNLFGKTGTYNVSTPEATSSSLENSSSAYSLLN
ncbi:PREDICTED: probable G-protein coupled receptor 116 isoform X2 [Colobus angolensis palliatus]|uniref:probable G-protein coupled receptor 116 isoform X2 n=1 Tax=Colobus angolensis palliatus TaxID=336983 RepID=UPI0005F4984F|nr:PREDICTED: probable G-protein coupled receptor 116 isoform X2 [Colobus angolensis palliatus]